MSFYYVRSIKVTKENILKMTIADSSIRPLYYFKFEKENYRNSVHETWKAIITNFRAGCYKVSGNSKTLQAIKQGMKELEPYDYILEENYCAYIYCKISGTSAEILDIARKAFKNYGKDTEYLKKALLENSGAWLYLSDEMKANENLAKFYVENNSDRICFDMPEILADNLDYCRKAVEASGCNYRQISDNMKNNKVITLAAFSSKKRPEHLPDLIGSELLQDIPFLTEIIKIQPHLHYDRFPSEILEKNEIQDALKKHNEYFIKKQGGKE